MANGGWHGTREQLERLEASLKTMDPDFCSFASKYNLDLKKISKDGPVRFLEWGKEVRCLIQVYLADETDLTLNLWICAFQDRAGKRYWKKELIRTEVSARQLAEELAELLETGKHKLDQWASRPEELEFATDLQM
ncbi:hypothetical protein RHODOSMS8_00767 [Rhodobiaceae bacterium]|nr:hypothetical protein RHODOSMS8_00767 [Rhodobiaceae bacterium]